MNIGEFEIALPARPLNNPHCIAFLNPWVNSGRVGEHVFRRISKIYGAKRIGALREPGMFYDFTRYRPQLTHLRGQRKYNLPNTILFAGHAPEGEPDANDLVLIYMLEPHAFGERFNDAVVTALAELKITRYILAGGMYDLVPHTRTLPVSAATSNWEMPGTLKSIGAVPPAYRGPTSVASLISQRLANDMHLETMSLITHLPLYHRPTNHHMGVARLLAALSKMYPLLAPTERDHARARETERKISAEVQRNGHIVRLVEQLEEKYDRSPLGAPTLSPDLEKFLKDVTADAPEGGGEHPPSNI